MLKQLIILTQKRFLMIEKRKNISISINKEECLLKPKNDDSLFVVGNLKKRPTMIQENYEIPFLSTSTWTAGRYRWEDLEITLKFDKYGKSIEFCNWLIKESIQKIGDSSTYKKDLELFYYDKNSCTIDKWSLQGCVIKSLDTISNFDYKNRFTINITFSFDRAILTN